jgi:Holliday junction resolvase RusA-like endonuclease
MTVWNWFIPMILPMNTAATRRHWSHGAKQAKIWRELVWMLKTRGSRVSMDNFPLTLATVTVTRHSSAAVHPDIDNLHMAAKPVFDALVKCGLLKDDGPNVARNIRWRPSDRAGHGTMIGIEAEL